MKNITKKKGTQKAQLKIQFLHTQKSEEDQLIIKALMTPTLLLLVKALIQMMLHPLITKI
jgi:hypothetical protein